MKQMLQIGLGKIQPQAIELEEAILGSCLNFPNAIIDISDLLAPESFYLETHKLVFKAILSLSNKGGGIDILTVTEELRRNKELELAEGALIVTQLSNKVAAATHIVDHAKIVQQKYVAREYIRICTEGVNDLYDDSVDVVETTQKLEKEFLEVGSSFHTGNLKSMAQTISDSIKGIEKAGMSKTHVTGVPTGYDTLDKRTGGWQSPDLIVIAGRPGMGKTTFMLNSVKNSSEGFGTKIGIFSLEMSYTQLGNKLLSMNTEINTNDMRTGNIKEEGWNKIKGLGTKMGDLPIWIDDTPALNIFDLKSRARRMKQKLGIELITVDYIQQIDSGLKTDNDNVKVGLIIRQLKALAKELNIPVIALSQLSRVLESRANKRPILADLRSSGEIEQEADLILFLYSALYYAQKKEDDSIPVGGDEVDLFHEIDIAKHRNGSLSMFKLEFFPGISTFKVPYINPVEKLTNNDKPF